MRVDSAAYQGYVIPPYYDSLVGKLIVHGRTRTEALMRLRRALDEFVVDGVETTLPLFRTLVRNADIQNGHYDIHWLEEFLKTDARGLSRAVRPRAPGRRNDLADAELTDQPLQRLAFPAERRAGGAGALRHRHDIARGASPFCAPRRRWRRCGPIARRRCRRCRRRRH